MMPKLQFKIAPSIQSRKAKVDEMIAKHGLNELLVLSFLSELPPEKLAALEGSLDSGDHDGLAGQVEEHGARLLVRHKMREVVRKKPGGGGYVLYSPNKGKKKQAKSSGVFPTKLGAKRAELSRFPPKDPRRLVRLRKEVDRLMKDPKKRAAAELKDRMPTPKREAVEEHLLRTVVRAMVVESLFREERSGSDWDEHLAKISKKALTGDKKLQGYQRTIEKKTESILLDAFKAIEKATRGDVKLKNHGIKHSQEKGKTYLAFEAAADEAVIGPIFIYADNGIPKIEVSDQAKAAMTKVDPTIVKSFRAELITVQERVLDRVEDLVRAVGARDKYLTKVEAEVDSFVAELNPLQISILKNLLVAKYRKLQ